MATPFKLRSGNTSSFKNMGSSPMKQPKEKRTMSVSDEQTIKDKELIKKSQDRMKEGGSGATAEDVEATKKAIRRQIIVDAQKGGSEGSRKELKKNVKGSKLKKFFTSTKKLRSESTAQKLKNVKVQEQVYQHDTKGGKEFMDKYSGVTEKKKSPAKHAAVPKHANPHPYLSGEERMQIAKEKSEKKKSPAKQKPHPAGTGVGHLGKGFNIKGYLKGKQGLIPDYKGQSTKKTVKKVKSKIKSKGRRAKIAADQIPYVGPSSSVYSTYAKAKKGTHMYDPKATVNQPGYEKEKAQILKNKGWSTKKK